MEFEELSLSELNLLLNEASLIEAWEERVEEEEGGHNGEILKPKDNVKVAEQPMFFFFFFF